MPDYPNTYISLGIIHMETANYQAAIDSFSAALQLDSGSARTYTNRGAAFYRLGRYQESIFYSRHNHLFYSYICYRNVVCG